MKTLSELYNADFKKNRGKAAEGFVRPTIGEYFMTHKDFTEVDSKFVLHDIFGDSSSVATYAFSGDAKDSGKNYDGIWAGNEQYVQENSRDWAYFDGNSYIYSNFNTDSIKTYSLFLKSSTLPNNASYILNATNYCFYIKNNYLTFNNSIAYYFGGVNLSNDIIYHIVFNTNKELWVNKTKYSITSSANSINIPSSGLHIGKRYQYSGNILSNSQIYMLRCFNRYLSDSEIELLYEEK